MKVSYTLKQRAIQKEKGCTLATIDIDTPTGRMTWQGPLNELGTRRIEEFMNRLIRQVEDVRP